MTTNRLKIAIVYVGSDGEYLHNTMLNNQQPSEDYLFIDCQQRIVTEYQELRNTLCQFDMTFLILMPGSLSTTAVTFQVVRACKESSSLTIGIAIDPFSLNNDELNRSLHTVWRNLFKCTDNIINIPSKDLLSIDESKLPTFDVPQLLFSFSTAIKELLISINGKDLSFKNFSDTNRLLKSGDRNFSDIKRVFKCGDLICVGRGIGDGNDRALQSARRAIDDVLQGCKIDNVNGVIIDISASENTLAMSEFMEMSHYIQSFLSKEVLVVIGVWYDDSLCDSMRVIAHAIVN